MTVWTSLKSGRLPVFGVLCLFLALLAWWLTATPSAPLHAWEQALHDGALRSGPAAVADPRLAFLAIDQRSFQRPDISAEEMEETVELTLITETWPWPREIFALAMARLFSAGARGVILGWPMPEPGEGDPMLHATLEQFPTQVVLSATFASDSPTNGQPEVALQLPTSRLRPDPFPLERIGYISAWPDPDGTVRTVRFRTTPEEVAGRPRKPGTQALDSLAAVVADLLGESHRIPSTFDAQPIRFAGPAGQRFDTAPFYEIFVPRVWETKFQSGEVFRDRVVLIAPDGPWWPELIDTPIGPMSAGQFHLHAANALLQGAFVRPLSQVNQLALLLLVGLWLWGMHVGLRSLPVRFAAVAGLAILYTAIRIWLLAERGIIMPALGPLLVLVGGAIGLWALDQAIERQTGSVVSRPRPPTTPRRSGAERPELTAVSAPAPKRIPSRSEPFPAPPPSQPIKETLAARTGTSTRLGSAVAELERSEAPEPVSSEAEAVATPPPPPTHAPPAEPAFARASDPVVAPSPPPPPASVPPPPPSSRLVTSTPPPPPPPPRDPAPAPAPAADPPRRPPTSRLGGPAFRGPAAVLSADLQETGPSQNDGAAIAGAKDQLLQTFAQVAQDKAGSANRLSSATVAATWIRSTTSTLPPGAESLNALAAASEMIAHLESVNRDLSGSGHPPLFLGVGLAHGDIAIQGGQIASPPGTPTAGDPIQMAALLKSLARQYRVHVLLNESVANSVWETFTLRTVDCIRLEGTPLPVWFFTVMPESPENLEWLVNYESAITLYRHGNFAEALERFARCHKHAPHDYLCTMFMDRCKALLKDPPQGAWTGLMPAR